MRAALKGLLMLSLLGARPSPPPAPPSACGQPDEAGPTLALLDMNPASPHFGERLGPGDFLGKVVVVYWATAT